MSIILTEEGIGAIIDDLPRFLDKVSDFIRYTLSSHRLNDSVTY